MAQADIDAAYEAADPEFIRTLTMAAGNIEAFHKRQIRRNFVINDTPGRGAGPEGDAHRAGGPVCARRHGQLPLQRADERYSGEDRRACRQIVMVTPPAPDGSVAPGHSGGRKDRGRDDRMLQARAARRPWRRWPTAPRACPRWIRSSARATSMWPRPSARYTAAWTST